MKGLPVVVRNTEVNKNAYYSLLFSTLKVNNDSDHGIFKRLFNLILNGFKDKI